MDEQNDILDEEAVIEEGETPALSGAETKLALALRVVRDLKSRLDNLERLLESRSETADPEAYIMSSVDDTSFGSFEGRSIEGVFDGEHMVGEDGRQYSVPPNYASKSKLVEGDLLRLTISENGRFLFKQKGPIERQRLVGSLVQDELSGDWKVVAGGNGYRVLAAAISFHKGDVGDEVVILVPKNAPSRWAAVENMIKKDGSEW
jgi:hypothetical protein